MDATAAALELTTTATVLAYLMGKGYDRAAAETLCWRHRTRIERGERERVYSGRVGHQIIMQELCAYALRQA